MQCPHCRQAIAINKEYCPLCGKRINISFDQIAHSVRDDAALRRGQELDAYLRWLIAGMLILCAVLWGLNDLWDRPLLFDGADLPALDAPPAELAPPGTILAPFRHPWQLESLPGLPRQVFTYRINPMKNELRDAHGGSQETSAAIQRGLEYLKKKQNPADGSWPVNTADLRLARNKDESGDFRWGRVGVTALALLAFQGEGEHWWPDAQGQRPPFADLLEKGLKFLVLSQDEPTGRFGTPEGHFMFNHALATQAVAEAAGRSGNAYLSAAAQKGVGMLERAQGSRGGWGYQDRLGERQDTSVTSFAVQALLASREAGLQVKEETLAKALKYLQDATDLRTANVAYGFEELKAAGDTSFHPAYTGVALMLRQQLGEHAASPAFKILVRRLAEFTPNSKPEWGKDWKGKDAKGLDAKSDNERAQVFDPYRWYFATYGLFFYGGEDWNAWNKALVKSLLELQDHDGAWRANDNNTVKAGAPFSTALCILTLQVYYRIH